MSAPSRFSSPLAERTWACAHSKKTNQKVRGLGHWGSHGGLSGSEAASFPVNSLHPEPRARPCSATASLFSSPSSGPFESLSIEIPPLTSRINSQWPPPRGCKAHAWCVSVEALCNLCGSVQVLMLVMVTVRVQGVAHLLPCRKLTDGVCARGTITEWKKKNHSIKQRGSAKFQQKLIEDRLRPNPGTEG